MKIPLISLLAAPVLASGMLLAQEPAPAAPAQPPAQHHQFQRGQRFNRMAAKLNLTDAQKTLAKTIWRAL